jgi:pimeloyl-ACP methyl ester carboxylesterase
MTLRPIEIRLENGETIAGIEEAEHASRFTLLFLHEPEGDLDAMLPLIGRVGLADVRKVAIDLPGHGLSSGTFAPGSASSALGAALADLRKRGWAPFLIVAAGAAAPLAWQLAAADDVMGLCLVSPRGAEALGESAPRCPILAFVSSTDTDAAADWQAMRAAVQSWCMVAAMALGHRELTEADGAAGSQVAAHLQGFARDMFMTSPLVAGRGG